MLFIDTANLADIRKFFDMGVVRGITTNRKIMASENKSFTQILDELRDYIRTLPYNAELHFEPIHLNVKDIRDYIRQSGLTDSLIVKVPMYGDGSGIHIAYELRKNDIKVNITCCMSLEQVTAALQIEPEYISIFFNRMIDYKKEVFGLDYDNALEDTINEVSMITDYLNRRNCDTLLIGGSIRRKEDVASLYFSGVDIVTVPPKILNEMFFHPKTEETIKEFEAAWNARSV